MKMRRNCLRWCTALLLGCTRLVAAPLPAQYLPADTLALVTVPDWTSFETALTTTPLGRLWNDPAMRPFREKTGENLQAKLLGEGEKELGIKAADFLPLLQGQVTLALLAGEWKPSQPDTMPSFIAIVDAKDHADQLKARLAEVREKLTATKRPARTIKIRDVEFTTVTVDAATTEAAKSGASGNGKDEDGDTKRGKSHELTFGQLDSVLILSNSSREIEKVAARLGGGTAPVVADVAEYQLAERTVGLKGASVFAWVNCAAAGRAVIESASAPQPGPMALDPKQIFKASGLEGLKFVALAGVAADQRETFTFAIGVPEANRSGLFKVFEFSAKDSGPIAVVPADVVRFSRLRLDGQKAWAAVESMISAISPQWGGVLSMTMGALGKDKDASFDFRKTFVGNLGDDIISYVKPAKGSDRDEIANPPSITLIGSGDAEKLLEGMRAGAGMLPTAGGEPKTREVNGHKVYQFAAPAGQGGANHKIEMAAAAGYVALATDPAVLEEFLRAGEGGLKSLKDTPWLADLAQSVGGMNSGFFGYSDDREALHALWEGARSGSARSNPAEKEDDPIEKGAADGHPLTEILDFKTLPPFEQVSKYLGRSVYGGSWDPSGFILKQVSTGSR